mgnify:CR=1 FL=1
MGFRVVVNRPTTSSMIDTTFFDWRTSQLVDVSGRKLKFGLVTSGKDPGICVCAKFDGSSDCLLGSGGRVVGGFARREVFGVRHEFLLGRNQFGGFVNRLLAIGRLFDVSHGNGLGAMLGFALVPYWIAGVPTY